VKTGARRSSKRSISLIEKPPSSTRHLPRRLSVSPLGFYLPPSVSIACSSCRLERTALPGVMLTGSGAGIAADAGFAGAHAEDAKARNSMRSRRSELLEASNTVSTAAPPWCGQARTLDHMMDMSCLIKGDLTGATDRLYYDLR